MALQNVMTPFQWGAGGRALTPEQIAREREIAEVLAAQGMDMSPVAHPLQGLARAAQAAAGAYKNYKADKAEDSGKAAFQDKWDSLAGSLLGGGSTGYGGGSVPLDSTEPLGTSGDFSAKAPTVISRLSGDLDITPEQAAGIVGQLGYESEGLQAINERKPVVPGSRGGFGWAQWTGPRRKQFETWASENGLDVTSDDANYGFSLHELKNTPEAGVLEAIRSAPDAQTAGRVFTDKFLRPGIPGYGSRAKWTDRALAAYQGQRPVQTASLDPTAGVAQALVSPRGPATAAAATEAMATGGFPMDMPYVDPTQRVEQAFAPIPAQSVPPKVGAIPQTEQNQRILASLLSPQPMGGEFAGMQQPQAPASVDPDPVSSIAASLTGANVDPDYPMAGGALGQGGAGAFPAAPSMGAFPPAPVQGQGMGQPSLAQLIDLAGDPYAPEGTRQVLGALIKQQMGQGDPYRQAQIAQLQAQTQKLQRDAANPLGDETFFGNPIAIQNADGSMSYGQMGNKGTFRPIQLPDGQTFAPPTKTINTQTEQIIVDQAGNVISRIPIQNREAAAETAAGTVEGRTAAERAAAAPADIQTGMTALDILDQIEKHPGLDGGTGLGSYGNVIPGTAGYDFQNLVEQAKSGAFLSAIQQMRGMGSLSNAEGAAATAAVTRMDTATSKEAFLAALRDYRKIVQQGIDRAQGNSGGQSPSQQPEQKKRLRFNPATGTLE